MKKVLKTLVSSLCVLSMVCGVTACGGGGNSSTQSQKAATFVNLDINPSIQLTVDGNNKVVSVYGGNDDGKILLYNGETVVDGIIGENVETAVANITEMAIDLGYLTEDNKVVGTSVSGSNADSIQNKINTKITATASALGLSVETDVEGAFSLLRKLENFKAEHPNNSVVQALTVEDFRLALSASETGEVSLEVAVTMDDSALVELISKAHKEIEHFSSSAFETAKEVVQGAYDKALAMAKAGVYVDQLTRYMVTNPALFAYGSVYMMYESSAWGFDLVADGLAMLNYTQSYPLTETQITAVLSALDMEDTADNRSLLKNNEGAITLESVENYLDVWYKNVPQNADIDAQVSAVKTALGQVDSAIAQQIETTKATYVDEVEAIISAGEISVGAMQAISSLLPEVLKTAITDFATISQDVVTSLRTNAFTEETLREYATSLKEKAQTVLAELDKELTDADRTAIANKLQEVEESLASMKAEVEQELEDMETELRNYLSEERAKRVGQAN